MMATQTQSETKTKSPAKAVAKSPAEVERALKRAARRKTRVEGRKKLGAKLLADKEFAKTYFEGRSKRAADKKLAFRKKKSRKK